MPVKSPEIVDPKLEIPEAASGDPSDSEKTESNLLSEQSNETRNDDSSVGDESHSSTTIVTQTQTEVTISPQTFTDGQNAANIDISITEQTSVEIYVAEESASDDAPTPAAVLTEMNVSALSLKSIRAKKELEKLTKANAKADVHLPTEAFNETDMLLQWTKYAQRLSDKGQKIMESLMLIDDPKLKGTTIIHQLPNESAKIDFESGKHDLVGYLRGMLHNHDIEINVVVNEKIDSRKAFTPQDRFNRLNEINPSLELLRKTFDLDF